MPPAGWRTRAFSYFVLPFPFLKSAGDKKRSRRAGTASAVNASLFLFYGQLGKDDRGLSMRVSDSIIGGGWVRLPEERCGGYGDQQ